MAPIVIEQTFTQRRITSCLHCRVDGRVDLVAFVLRCGAEPLHQFEARHLCDIRRLYVKCLDVFARADDFAGSTLFGRRIDEAELAHTTQYVAATLGCRFRIVDGVVARGCLRHSRKRRRFSQRELCECLAEIKIGSRRHATGAFAERDHVQVKTENLFFAEFSLDAIGQEHLLTFATPSSIIGQKEILCGLLRDRAGAFESIARNEIDDDRAQNRLIVEAGVLKKSIVFCCDEGLADDGWDLLERDGYSALLTDLRDRLSVARIHAQRHLQLNLAHRLDTRQAGGEVEIGAGDANYQQGRRTNDRREAPEQDFRRRQFHGDVHVTGMSHAWPVR